MRATLTPIQRVIVQLMAQRMRDKQIAEALEISLSGVHQHRRNILRRLQVPNRRAAAARARELGLLRPGT